MGITRQELNPRGYTLTPEQDSNLTRLLEVMNVVRAEYGHPMIVTSGVRTLADQKRIDAKRIVGGKPAGPRLGSAHLKGAAVDIWDRDGELWTWCLDHLDRLTQLGLYLEDRTRTPAWVHFQTIAPRSGNRIFLP